MKNEDVKKPEVDPMNADKKDITLEEQAVEGGFFPTSAESSKVNSLDAVSYDDIKHVFGTEVVSEDAQSEEDNTSGSANNVAEDAEDVEDVEEAE